MEEKMMTGEPEPTFRIVFDQEGRAMWAETMDEVRFLDKGAAPLVTQQTQIQNISSTDVMVTHDDTRGTCRWVHIACHWYYICT